MENLSLLGRSLKECSYYNISVVISAYIASENQLKVGSVEFRQLLMPAARPLHPVAFMIGITITHLDSTTDQFTNHGNTNITVSFLEV